MQYNHKLEFIKNKLFPIKNYEYKKIILLCIIKGITSFVFSILFSIKDAAIVTSAQSGAEVIPVLKSTLVLPCSILIVLMYTKLSNYLNFIKIIYIFLFVFFILFLFYGFVLLPNESSLTPTQTADKLLNFFGSKNKHWIAVYRYWIHSFFFVISEMWGQICLFIVFWGFVNQICSIDEAKRSYNLFIASGSVGGILQAPVLYFFKKNISGLMLVLMICCIIMAFLYWYVKNFSFVSNYKNKKKINNNFVEKKTKLSIKDSIKYILSSKYLLYVAITVISCGLSINLIQITWKANLKALYPNKEGYLSFMSMYDVILNIVSFFVVFFVSGNFIRKYGWKKSSLVPPVIIGITGVMFFILSKFQGQVSKLSLFFRLDSLSLVVLFGTFQAVISKVAKYSFFDITKEIVYIPLDQESKIKGKAAIDTVGSRFGKSSSSFIHIIALWVASTSEVLSITLILIPFLIFIICLWTFVVNKLDILMKQKNKNKFI